MGNSNISLTIYICSTLLLLLPTNCEASKVVATGDSITNGYYSKLPLAAANNNINIEFVKIGDEGLRSTQYVGDVQHPYNTGLRNYAIEVVNQKPDYVFFMLGTNDCYGDYYPENSFLTYKQNLQEIFETFKTNLVDSKIYISTLVPIIASGNIAANVRIDDWYNPWLRQTVGNYGFNLVDMNTLLKQADGWQSMYGTDGVHLTPAGYTWMADQWINAVVATPEPASMLFMALGVIALRRKHKC